MKPNLENTPLEWKKILVATDFSIASEIALEWAKSWADKAHSELYIAYVNTTRSDKAPLSRVERREVAEEIEQEFSCNLRRLHGVAHQFVFLEGKLGKAIQSFVFRNNIDAVFVGTHGRRGARRSRLGSGAESILRAVQCPVVTVGIASANYSRPSDGVRRILFPTDFSPNSLAALTPAIALANAQMARLILLHVAQDAKVATPDASEPVTDHADALARLLDEGRTLKLPAEFLCEHGDPAQGILTAARNHTVDLIVWGIGDLKRLQPKDSDGAISNRVICQAQCPVVTFRSFHKGRVVEPGPAAGATLAEVCTP